MSSFGYTGGRPADHASELNPGADEGWAGQRKGRGHVRCSGGLVRMAFRIGPPPVNLRRAAR